MTLTLEDISHRFGDVEAVTGAGLSAAAGEIVCLFGPSGCGKTTLLRIAAGLEPLQKGRVMIDGAVVAEPGREVAAERRPVGFVFQDYVLFPHMSVGRNVAFGVVNRGRGAREIVADELKAVGLEGFEKRYPHELSGGQQQRVALARALAPRPKALLLDEPFASIDVVLRRRLREGLRRLLKARSVAVVLVTHDPEEALALGDRVALMRGGRVIEAAAPEALFASPQTADGAAIFPDSQRIHGATRDGVLNTAFGDFPADGLANGAGVAVLRAGALSAAHDPTGQLRVVDTRFAGPGYVAYLASEAAGADELIRVMTDAPLEIGARVRIDADPASLFVFSA
jgi:iron(III) transport system ATP-binding protein